MDQLKKLLAALSGKQQITMAIAVLLVGGGIFGLTRWRQERDFKPLYTGLAPAEAGAVVQKLNEGGLEYRRGRKGRGGIGMRCPVLSGRGQVARGRRL